MYKLTRYLPNEQDYVILLFWLLLLYLIYLSNPAEFSVAATELHRALFFR